MDPLHLKAILHEVASGALPPDAAAERMRHLPFEDLGFAKIDHHRALRKGYPETIFCAGKTPAQVVEIATRMRAHGSNVLGTRVSPDIAEAVLAAHADATHNAVARTVSIVQHPPEPMDGYIAIVCAGTSDLPVAEEAAVTCELFGNRIERITDVGVAGIHRLFEQRERIVAANVVIVCAGMEGALPSVVAGLVDCPVIGVPTSIGYGASFNGIAALLGMLNSCASGLTVVNIDNGFGAAAAAAAINRIANGKHL
jgi:NCAIR mutase (PurE)-related protein